MLVRAVLGTVVHTRPALLCLSMPVSLVLPEIWLSHVIKRAPNLELFRRRLARKKSASCATSSADDVCPAPHQARSSRSGWRSSRRRRSGRSRRRSAGTASTWTSLPADDTTRASCRAPCPWSRPWLPSCSRTSCSGCATLLTHASLLSCTSSSAHVQHDNCTLRSLGSCEESTCWGHHRSCCLIQQPCASLYFRGAAMHRSPLQASELAMSAVQHLLADSGNAAAQHVAQCEVLPRGEGPSPDARVNTQLRVPVQPAQTLEHLTAAV